MKKLIVIAMTIAALVSMHAHAGDLTVAHTDLALAGGVSASYNMVSDMKDADYFTLDSAVIYLLKNPTMESPVGGHLAFANFQVKVAGLNVAPAIPFGVGTENFRVWLGYFSWLPVENLTVDAGLLWHKFGEAPVTILNPHVSRPISFLAQPVCFGGARVGYKAGIASIYAGMNDGSALGSIFGNKNGQVSPEDGVTILESDSAIEAGISLMPNDMLSIAANYFDHGEGYNTVNFSAGVTVDKLSAKVEGNMVSNDTVAVGAEDSATAYVVYASYQASDQVKLPIRYEMLDDNDSGIYLGFVGYTITVTPTYNPTANSFIRLEYVMTSDDNKVFADSDGVAAQEEARNSIIAEFGFLF